MVNVVVIVRICMLALACTARTIHGDWMIILVFRTTTSTTFFFSLFFCS